MILPTLQIVIVRLGLVLALGYCVLSVLSRPYKLSDSQVGTLYRVNKDGLDSVRTPGAKMIRAFAHTMGHRTIALSWYRQSTGSANFLHQRPLSLRETGESGKQFR